MPEIKVGDRVTYLAGRGSGVGRVANIETGGAFPVAKIATEKGKFVNRLLSALKLAEVVENVRPEEAAKASEVQAC